MEEVRKVWTLPVVDPTCSLHASGDSEKRKLSRVPYSAMMSLSLLISLLRLTILSSMCLMLAALSRRFWVSVSALRS